MALYPLKFLKGSLKGPLHPCSNFSESTVDASKVEGTSTEALAEDTLLLSLCSIWIFPTSGARMWYVVYDIEYMVSVYGLYSTWYMGLSKNSGTPTWIPNSRTFVTRTATKSSYNLGKLLYTVISLGILFNII